MPRKKTAPKKPKQKQEKIDPNIEEIYEETISFMCPVRGLVTQKVKVKRYKPQVSEEKPVLKDSDSDLLSKIDSDDDSISIFTEEELSSEDT